MTMPLRKCRDCKTPKDINKFSPKEWPRAYPICCKCVANRHKPSKTPKAGTEHWRRTMRAVVS